MSETDIRSIPEGLGCTVIERQLLESLSHLWDGPISPSELGRVEKSLRAFLTGQTLVVARFFGANDQGLERAISGNYEIHDPFSNGVLDYEFILGEKAQPFKALDQQEASFLEQFAVRAMRQEALSGLPKWISRRGEFYAYLDAWYEGASQEECEEWARTALTSKFSGYDEEEYYEPFDPADDYHSAFDPSEHATYLVGCHRAGAVVYGDSPMAVICAEHIFSRWPEELFQALDDDFKQAALQLRGPGISVLLPPLTSIIMTRASRRTDIPEVIREMREEYEKARNELWILLTQMWFANPLKEQLKFLKQLENASRSIFPSAFPEKLDVLSLGLTLAPLTPSAVASSAKILLDRDKPRSRVGALSFSQKLAKDLRKQFGNSRHLLKRHLTDAELRDFGF